MKKNPKQPVKDLLGMVIVLIITFGALILLAYFWTIEHEGEELNKECDFDNDLCVEWEE